MVVLLFIYNNCDYQKIKITKGMIHKKILNYSMENSNKFFYFLLNSIKFMYFYFKLNKL